MTECEHKEWKCVGDHSVVCANCGHTIVDGRKPEVILAEKVDNLSAEVAALRKDADRMGYALASIAGGHWRGDVQEFAARAITDAGEITP